MIYDDTYTFEQLYIGKTRLNVEIRWEENEDTQKDAEPAKYLRNHQVKVI